MTIALPIRQRGVHVNSPQYDAFISYSHKDKDWVWDWLVPRLKAAGFNLCTDRESFDIGVPSLINMENAVAQSAHTVLVGHLARS
jgi:hypothetical protein